MILCGEYVLSPTYRLFEPLSSSGGYSWTLGGPKPLSNMGYIDGKYIQLHKHPPKAQQQYNKTRPKVSVPNDALQLTKNDASAKQYRGKKVTSLDWYSSARSRTVQTLAQVVLQSFSSKNPREVVTRRLLHSMYHVAKHPIKASNPPSNPQAFLDSRQATCS